MGEYTGRERGLLTDELLMKMALVVGWRDTAQCHYDWRLYFPSRVGVAMVAPDRFARVI